MLSKKDLMNLLAVSSENEIAFKLRNNSFVAASYSDSGELRTYLTQTPRETTINKYVVIGLMFMAHMLVGFSWRAFIKAGNMFIILLHQLMTFLYLITASYLILSIKAKKSTKKNHAAEHMVANYMIKNLKVPENISEFKSETRFSPFCGIMAFARILMATFFKYFLSSTLIAILGCTMNLPEKFLSGIGFFILPVAFLTAIVAKSSSFWKNTRVYDIYEKICMGVSYMLQAASTSKPSEKELELACAVVNEWYRQNMNLEE